MVRNGKQKPTQPLVWSAVWKEVNGWRRKEMDVKV